jgi:hypothetical protein
MTSIDENTKSEELKGLCYTYSYESYIMSTES